MTNAPPDLPPSQRVHLILLGVDDIERSRQFYESLGWSAGPKSNPDFTMFDLGGYALCLLDRNHLKRDSNTDSSEGFGGTCLVHLVETSDQVQHVLDKAAAAGGTIVKPATVTPYGVAGYFCDPDGHLFEVDWEDSWVFDDDHRLIR